MKLEETISGSIINYKSMFWTNDWVLTRKKVLNHLFVVIGNGFGWHKETGEMVDTNDFDCDYETNIGWTAFGKPIRQENKPEHILTEKTFYELVGERMSKKEKELKDLLITIDECEDENLINELKSSVKTRFYNWKPYGILSSGYINNLPDNIEDSWLEGAKEIAGYLREYYLDGEMDNYRQCYKDLADDVYTEKCLDALDKVDARIKEIEDMR